MNENAGPGKGNILVVDDTHASLKLLVDLLTEEGYLVRAADSGKLALASVAARPPELILLDVRMPDMDGMEVMRRLRECQDSRDIPVVFLSAVTGMEQRVEGLKLGAVDFVAKPFQREELLARVQTHVELSRARRQIEHQAANLHLANEQLQIEIAERKRAEASIQRVAHHDSLTGLPNRLLFNDRLDQAISLARRDSRQFALLYLDLDRFKIVNDTLGHTAGDKLLHEAAGRVRQQVRESDTVARVGGDEFTVILPDITRREEAEVVARKITAAVATPFQLDSQKQCINIAASIGIAVYPTDGEDADALVKAADAAMYSAKQTGDSFRFCATPASGDTTRAGTRNSMRDDQVMNRGAVLVVDDTHASLKLLSDLLAAEGYAVRAADSGELALASIAAKPPELILLDIRMPGMDGFEVMRRLRALEKGRDTPVIFLSAITETEQRVQGLALGAVDFISKPFQREELLARVQTHVELRRTRTQLEHRAADLRLANEQLRVEIIERKTAEAKSQRMSQLYAALSQCNQAIVRCVSEEQLFPQICRDAVHFGGMKLARISLVDPATRMVRVAASFGEGSEDPGDPDISVDADSPFGRGPTGIALRENRPYWCQDFMRDPATAPWRERGARLGWGSIAALPLHRNGAVIGAFVLFDGEVGAFDEARRQLLLEMAMDISFAIDNFGREAERKRMEEKLIVIVKAVESTGDAIGISDAQGRHVYQNKALSDLFGYASAEELETAGGGPAVVKDLAVAREMFETIMSGKSWAGELDMVTMSGRVFPAYERADAIKNEAGKIVGLIGIITDITDRKRQAQSLQESEMRFRGLIEQSLTGIYITQNGVFLYANPRLEQMLGYGAGEMVGLRADDLAVAEDLPTLQAEREKLRAGATSISYEGRARRRDGAVIELGVQGRISTFNGQPATVGMAQDITEKKRAEAEIQRYVEQLKTAFMSTVEVATTLSEMRDPYTAGHERRVACISVAIGIELGFDTQRQDGLRVAGYLHDIGKITIPAEILSKPGKLNAIQFKLIQGHAQASYDVLKGVEFPWSVAKIALQHHERLDGSGYPQGLKGEAILLEARILAVADVVEAMASHRPYRVAFGIDTALAEIERGRSTVYDPVVADACLKLFREQGYAIPD